MEGLRTARVLVIDDSFEEAEPFLDTLWCRGIGCVYLSGKVEELSQPAFVGIRLVALDLDLGESGAEDPGVVSSTMEFLKAVISEKNGPYLVIAWTSKDDLYLEFQKQVALMEVSRRPVGVVKFRKAGFKSDPDLLYAELNAEVDKHYPFSVLLWWEQLSSNCSGRVMEVVAAEGSNEDWANESAETLALLRNASSRRIDPSEVRLRGLLGAFSALHLDALEVEMNVLTSSDADKLLDQLGNKRGAAGRKPVVNSRLLFGEHSPGIAPGNIYALADLLDVGGSLFPDAGKLVDDMFDPNKMKEDNDREELVRRCIGVAVEVSAACDYQWGKTLNPVFLFGLFVPEGKVDLLKERAAFLHHFASVSLDRGLLQGNLSLVCTSHYLGAGHLEGVGQINAILRLRREPLIGVQAWLGSQANRPGYLVV